MGTPTYENLVNTVSQLRTSNKDLRKAFYGVECALKGANSRIIIADQDRAVMSEQIRTLTRQLDNAEAQLAEHHETEVQLARLSTMLRNVVHILNGGYSNQAIMLSDLRAMFGLDKPQGNSRTAHGSIECDHQLNKENGQR